MFFGIGMTVDSLNQVPHTALVSCPKPPAECLMHVKQEIGNFEFQGIQDFLSCHLFDWILGEFCCVFYGTQLL